MYTFIVGPWLPTSSAISEGLIHKLNHLMHWLQLCLLLHSSKLQKFHLFPYSCELEHLSKRMKNKILKIIIHIVINPNAEIKILHGLISSNQRRDLASIIQNKFWNSRSVIRSHYKKMIPAYSQKITHTHIQFPQC